MCVEANDELQTDLLPSNLDKETPRQYSLL